MADEPEPKVPPGTVRPKTWEEMSEAERFLYGPRPSGGRKRKYDPIYDEPGDADINGEVDDDD